MRYLMFAIILAASACLANPPKLSSSARMDLVASPSVGSIDQGSASFGGGSIARMNWIPVAEQPLTYSASWPITHFRWSEIALSFTPASNGWVDVDLLGPWEVSPSGTIYRQEVLWDAIIATGTSITNGSFEELPAGWSNPWGGDVVTGSTNPLPVDGSIYGIAWHDGRLRTRIAATAGQSVTLHAWVRARVPDGFADNPRITDTDSAAHRMARRLMRGINFSNFLEANPGEDWGGGPLTTGDFDAVAAQGFDHVRLPVRWNAYTGPAPTHTISNELFARVDFIVTNLLVRDVNVMLNIHHFDEFFDSPSTWTNKLFSLWQQIAAHYASQPDGLVFEVINEPHNAATTEIMNSIYAAVLPMIRDSNPMRTIVVGPGSWNSIGELPALRLPANDSNLIVTVHNYEPFYFTHQGATWTGSSAATTNVTYPGPPPSPVSPHPAAAGDSGVVSWFQNYNSLPLEQNPCSSNAFEQSYRVARDWSDYYGRPVHVGEFGAYNRADASSRARFYREARAAMDRQGLGWAAWDWKAGFNYWDRNLSQPAPGLREAFFPAPVLRETATPLSFMSDLAIGKTLLVETAADATGPWSVAATQLLYNALLVVQLVPDQDSARGFLRLRWMY